MVQLQPPQQKNSIVDWLSTMEFCFIYGKRLIFAQTAHYGDFGGVFYSIVKHVLGFEVVDVGDVVEEAELGVTKLARGVGELDYCDCGEAQAECSEKLGQGNVEHMRQRHRGRAAVAENSNIFVG